MMRLRLVFPLFLAMLAAAGPAVAAETAGVVRKSAGVARVVRQGNPVPATVGMKLLPGDAIETGRDGSVGIVLRDDSLVSLGPDSRFAIDRFLFAPAEGKLGLVGRLSRGTLEYLSGIIGKLAPESVRFDTPVSSIGIRGTHVILKSDPATGER
jgi:hypothetical protein